MCALVCELHVPGVQICVCVCVCEGEYAGQLVILLYLALYCYQKQENHKWDGPLHAHEQEAIGRMSPVSSNV